ncbi:hypothetical protein [Deinococcus ruber]|uniref:Uncharacterized protein n=1 Tax=Deinococcus ruber TaxID=1848197 RepID=A0A918FD76_9DEIO|nr:hypothetical protein [Deinococcus ruber]GGR29026.1 hypothetical protein GCM10008957_45170 [Deinococcus ruber]
MPFHEDSVFIPVFGDQSAFGGCDWQTCHQQVHGSQRVTERQQQEQKPLTVNITASSLDFMP